MGFGLVAFAVVISLASCGIPAIFFLFGIPILVLLFRILVLFGKLDLSLSTWALRGSPQTFKFVSPQPPWQTGCRIFCSEVWSSGILCLLAYFVFVKLPIAVMEFSINVVAGITPIVFLSSPIIFLFGSEDMCMPGLGNSTALPTGLSFQHPCPGLKIDSIGKSFYPCLPGLVILPFGVATIASVSLGRAWLVKRILAEPA